MDEKTERQLDAIFGEKLLISLSRFAQATGFTRSTLEDYIAAGTLKAISTKKHVHISRPMAVEFLTQGGGIATRGDTPMPPPPLSKLKRAAMAYAEKNIKRRKPR